MCVHMHEYVCVYMYIYMYIYRYTYIYIYIFMYKYRRREALKLRNIRNFRDPVTVRHKRDHRVLRIEEFGVERIDFALLNQLPPGI